MLLSPFIFNAFWPWTHISWNNTDFFFGPDIKLSLFKQRRFIITSLIYLKDLPFWFYSKVNFLFEIYGAKNHEFRLKSMWVILLMNSWLEFLWVELKMWGYLFSAFLHFFTLFRFPLWLQDSCSYSFCSFAGNLFSFFFIAQKLLSLSLIFCYFF